MENGNGKGCAQKVNTTPSPFVSKTTGLTFFHMGTVRFNSLIAKSTASSDSVLCGDDTAINTLISPIGHSPNLCCIITRVTSHLLRICE